MGPMKRSYRLLLLILAGYWTPVLGQEMPEPEDEGPTTFTLAASGGVLFVNPSALNNSFTMVNTTLDESVKRLNTVYPLGLHLRMSIGPRSYLVLRGDFIHFTRGFSYDAVETSTSGTPSGTFRVTDDRTYNTIPFGLGVGFMMNKKRTMEFEIGFIYAFSTIDESGSMGSFGTFHSTADGSGWGGWVAVRPRIRITESMVLSPEFGWRFLRTEEFHDQKGRTLPGFSMDLRGVSAAAVLSISFSR